MSVCERVFTGVLLVGFLAAFCHQRRRRQRAESVFTKNWTSKPFKVCVVLFLICFATTALAHFLGHRDVAALAGLLGSLALVVGMLFGRRDSRREQEAKRALYASNVAKHPDAFASDAPRLSADDLPPMAHFKVYDDITAEYYGEIAREQLQWLIRTCDEADWGRNGIFVLEETIDLLEEQGADPGLIAFLHDAIGEKGFAKVRWIIG